MKLSLVVMTAGKMEGKSIQINTPEFVIGRDPQCQLRPASPMISKRHCCITFKDGKATVTDFNSTNGTFINGEQVQGERSLTHHDNLRVGPLDFRVVMVAAPALTPAPVAKSKPAAASDDDAALAMLLSMGDDAAQATPTGSVDSQGIPTGSTVMQVLNPESPEATQQMKAPGAAGEQAQPDSKAGDREKAAKAAQANTSVAAKAILEKYMRRPRV